MTNEEMARLRDVQERELITTHARAYARRKEQEGNAWLGTEFGFTLGDGGERHYVVKIERDLDFEAAIRGETV